MKCSHCGDIPPPPPFTQGDNNDRSATDGGSGTAQGEGVLEAPDVPGVRGEDEGRWNQAPDSLV